jgi:hypothetical protein
MKYDTTRISQILNIDNNGIIDIDLSQDEKWDCYSDDVINRRKNTVALYWKNLKDDERVERLKNHGMTGKKHNSKTIEKMHKSSINIQKPHLHKGGKLIDREGNIIQFSCLSHFCKEYKLSSGHVCELLQGKRKSVKGWKNVI